MKRIFILCVFSILLFMQGCVEDLQKETEYLVGRWEYISAEQDSIGNVLVLYYEIKKNNTLEEGLLKRNIQTNAEVYQFVATGDFIAKGGSLEIENYTIYTKEDSAGNIIYAPKEELVRDGSKSTRSISYKLLENNTVLSIYQGCPADVCYDILYEKK